MKSFIFYFEEGICAGSLRECIVYFFMEDLKMNKRYFTEDACNLFLPFYF